MALNFPDSPEIGDQYTSGSVTWEFDGTVWNILPQTTNSFVTFTGDIGTSTADQESDTFNIVGGTNVDTSITGKTLTINSTGGTGTTQNLFETIVADDGSTTASSPTETLSILGGTNISTLISTDTVDIEINMEPFEIGFLSNVSNASAATGQVLKWDGAQWAPGTDISSGGGGDTTSVIAPVAFARVADTVDASGTNINWSNWQAGPGTLDFSFSVAQADTNYIVVSDSETFDDYYVGISSKTVNGFTASFYDSSGVRAPSGASPFSLFVYASTPTVDVSVGANADTLDGFEGTYYLDYNNFTNTPSVVTLTDLSVGNELAASGDGAISYDNTTGVFRYTPPDLSAYSTFDGAFSSLTGKPTTISGYGITDAFDGTFTSLTGTPTTLAGYGITDAPTDLTDLGISDGSAGQVLTTDGAGNFSFTTVSGGGGGGDVNQNAFSIVAVSGQVNVLADSETDTLNIAAGTGINITTDASTDTVTITNTVSAGASDFTDLGDVTTANIRVDQIYEPAIVMLRVDNDGTSAYTFNSHYSGNNPTIFALSGTTIAFDLSGIGGHPFEIQDPLSSPYNTGLVHVATDGTVSTGSNAQGKSSGTLYWRVPESISGNYRYQCQSHAPMVGAITVKRFTSI